MTLVSCLLLRQVSGFPTMAKNSRTIVFLLGVTLVVIVGFNLSSPEVKYVLSTVASAVWGS